MVNKYENHWTPGKLFDGLGNVTDTAAVDDISANVDNVILFGFELSQKACGAVPEDVAAKLKHAVKSRRLQSTQRDVDNAAERRRKQARIAHFIIQCFAPALVFDLCFDCTNFV